MIEITTNSDGVEVITITNDDGTTLSMAKSTWDELEAAKEAQSL